MNIRTKQVERVMIMIGLFPIIWLALLIAPYIPEGLPGILANMDVILTHPFHIEFCGDSLRTVLCCLLIYGVTVGCVYSSGKNYRRDEEHGSARWGDVKQLARKYGDRKGRGTRVFTQNVQMGLDGKKHKRNLNTVVVGGSGAGKTRGYCLPNILQGVTSMFILDPKGEELLYTGNHLEEQGYEIRVLDLIDMNRSHGYNPFVYLRNDNDVQRLVTNLFKSTRQRERRARTPSGIRRPVCF